MVRTVLAVLDLDDLFRRRAEPGVGLLDARRTHHGVLGRVDDERRHADVLERRSADRLDQRHHRHQRARRILPGPILRLPLVGGLPSVLLADEQPLQLVAPRPREQRRALVARTEVRRDQYLRGDVRGLRALREPQRERAAGRGADDDHAFTQHAADGERFGSVAQPVLCGGLAHRCRGAAVARETGVVEVRAELGGEPVAERCDLLARRRVAVQVDDRERRPPPVRMRPDDGFLGAGDDVGEACFGCREPGLERGRLRHGPGERRRSDLRIDAVRGACDIGDRRQRDERGQGDEQETDATRHRAASYPRSSGTGRISA